MRVSDIPDNFTGTTFFNAIARAEDVCSRVAVERIPQLGKLLPECYNALGLTLALLDTAAACGWGCSKGDHRIEYLVGRAANSAYAGISLTKRGYYDQALSVSRSLGEIANLMSLFAADPNLQNKWKTIDEPQRRREFSAVRVRLALERLDAPVVMDEERYAKLSGYSIHADPNSVPQAHNSLGQAVTAPIYQEAGFILTVNEIALPVAFIAVFAPQLLNYSAEHSKVFENTAKVIIQALGGVNVMETGRRWFKLH